MDTYFFFALALTACILNAEAVRFMLASGARKCLKEELHKDVLVTGEYDIQDNGQRADITVSDERHSLFIFKSRFQIYVRPDLSI